MRHPMRVLALACALTLTPACAALQLGTTRIENPIAAAQTIDQRAYALLHSYAAIVEEATDIVSAPATPHAFKRTLGQAERAATPATETLQIAVTAYVHEKVRLRRVVSSLPQDATNVRPEARTTHEGQISKNRSAIRELAPR